MSTDGGLITPIVKSADTTRQKSINVCISCRTSRLIQLTFHDRTSKLAVALRNEMRTMGVLPASLTFHVLDQHPSLPFTNRLALTNDENLRNVIYDTRRNVIEQSLRRQSFALDVYSRAAFVDDSYINKFEHHAIELLSYSNVALAAEAAKTARLFRPTNAIAHHFLKHATDRRRCDSRSDP